MENDDLHISLTLEKDWKGVLKFDAPRHKTIMNMPFDWPRINQFPEWFTPEKNGNYEWIDFSEAGEQTFSDQQLIDGISLSLQKGANQFILKKKK